MPTHPTPPRLHMGLPAKDKIECASTLLTLPDTVVRCSGDEVHHHSRTLSDLDREIFLAVLEDDSEPNDALRQATRRYKQRTGGNRIEEQSFT